jgi:hypothetical protein
LIVPCLRESGILDVIASITMTADDDAVAYLSTCILNCARKFAPTAQRPRGNHACQGRTATKTAEVGLPKRRHKY